MLGLMQIMVKLNLMITTIVSDDICVVNIQKLTIINKTKQT